MFSVIGLAPAVAHRTSLRWWALAIAIAFFAAPPLAPGILRPLNKTRFRLGPMLNHAVGLVFGKQF
jgi:maltodextrin utilization protein YvdJ